MISLSDPKQAIHSYTFNQFKSTDYDKTQKTIRECLERLNEKEHSILIEYLQDRIQRNQDFEPYKVELIQLILELKEKRLEEWTYNLKDKGFTKRALYNILLELFVYVKFNNKTKNDDRYYDLVADFLDRFTYLGKNYRIFPDELDV